MRLILSGLLLSAMLLHCTRVKGMAVDPRLRYQDGIAKQAIQFSEDTDAICESHRNYRQASVEPTTPVKKDASGATDELKILIKHHKTPTDEKNEEEEEEEVDNPTVIKRPVKSSDENEQLIKDLEKKMDSLESKDKYPKTRSYPETVLHHKSNRYDRPSNGNLEVFLGGSSSDDSDEQRGFAAQEWQYQGFDRHDADEDNSNYHQEPLKRRYNIPIYPVKSYEGDSDRYDPHVEHPESYYEKKGEPGYRASGARSDEYVLKKISGYRNRGEGEGSGEYSTGRKLGYKDKGSDEYVTQIRNGYRTRINSDEEIGYDARKKSVFKGYGNSGYLPGNENDNYGKQENNPREEVLVKISVNNDQDSPDVGKVKVDVNKDKELYPDERQLKISVKKDKDLPPGEEREIKLEVRSDHEQEYENKVESFVGKGSCESGDDRTVIQVKKPKRKCCKKRKNKSSRKRKY